MGLLGTKKLGCCPSCGEWSGQVKEYKTVLSELNPTNWLGWVTTNLSVSENAYALKINDKSLPLPFSYDSTIIVDPNVQR